MEYLSENQRLSETYIVINDKSQGNVATHLGCGELFSDHFTSNLSFCLLVKEFLPRDAMLARYMPWSCVCVSVRVSVCLSVTSRSSTKMAKHRKTQTTPHDSPGTLVF